MDGTLEGIHGVADILPGFGPGDVGSIPTGSVKKVIEIFFAIHFSFFVYVKIYFRLFREGT